jgi:hypothetical protein
MPVFVQDGTRLKALCSGRWKTSVMQRWLRSKGVEQCDVWVGYSLDEMRRVRTSDLRWYQYRYPLIFDVPLRRGECLKVVEDMGWPTPPKSACFMCPNRDDEQWLDMQKNWPDDFARAVAFEREMQEKRSDFYLHRSLKPLDQVEFGTSQRSFFRTDDENTCLEGCFT